MFVLLWGIIVTVLLQGVDGLSRSPCTREARLDNPIKGYSLDGNVLATVNVNNAANCVIECLEHPGCQSINFHVSANPEHVCELNSKTDNDVTLTANSDVIYYGPSEMPNCAVDGPGECQNGGQCAMSCSRDQMLMCHCPEGRTGPTCQNKTVIPKNQDFVMVFPTWSVENYILVDNTGTEMSMFTLLFWINTLSQNSTTILTYSTETDVAVIRLVVDKGTKLWLNIQGETRGLPLPAIKDGYWHHMGLTWSLGNCSLYLDGTLIQSGDGFGPPTPITGGGTFHLGQRLLHDGTYDITKSFEGKLSQVNIWDEIMTADEIKSISKSCYNNVGTILDWSTVVDKTHGAVYKTHLGFCTTLRNDQSYDVVMSANASESTEQTYIMSSVSVSTFKALTIAAWVKHSEYLRYVDYKSNGQTALLFHLHKDVLILEIAGADTKQARVPRYWKESPAHWHHITTTWLSSNGQWKIYLDGSLVSIMYSVGSGIELPTQGELFMGLGNPDNGDNSMDGSLSRLNIWDYEVDGEALSLMANKGPLFENGNVFAWYGVKSKAVGDVSFQETPSELFNSRASAEYQMTFPESSSSNFVRIYDVFPNPLTTFAACFWAKILTYYCGIYTYSTNSYDSEITAFLYTSYTLDLLVHHSNSYGPQISHGEWHFYCQQWRSSDGLVETWQDAIKLQDSTCGVGKVLEAGGALVLGQEVDSFAGGFSSSQAYKGSLAGLNFWTEFLTSNEIQGMAAGAINVNGNLFQWRAYRDHAFGAVTIEKKSDAHIPEYQLQKARNSYCHDQFAGTHARFVRNEDDGYIWRCIRPVAMLAENMCYDVNKADSGYFSREEDILAIV